MGGKCDNEEGDLNCIHMFLEFQDIREVVTLHRGGITEVRV